MTERPRLTWSTAEVAAELGYSSVQGFYRVRQRLRAAGFPEPVPGLTNRYDPVAIAEWLRRARSPAASTHEGRVPPADDDAYWDRYFEERLALIGPAAGRA